MGKKHKTNKAKRVDPGCRNNGSCPVCTGNRTHSNEVRQPLPFDLNAEAVCEELDDFNEYIDENTVCHHGKGFDEYCELCEEEELIP